MIVFALIFLNFEGALMCSLSCTLWLVVGRVMPVCALSGGHVTLGLARLPLVPTAEEALELLRHTRRCKIEEAN